MTIATQTRQPRCAGQSYSAFRLRARAQLTPEQRHVLSRMKRGQPLYLERQRQREQTENNLPGAGQAAEHQNDDRDQISSECNVP